LFIGTFDALVLIALSLFLGYKLLRKKKACDVIEPDTLSEEASANDEEPDTRTWQAVAYMLLGLILLIVSAEALVASASAIAETLGVSEAVIGLTIVALGTSLPELAASITCVLKGHYDLAIGNIVGSNILNLLAVLPFPGLLSPGLIQAPLLFRDFAAVTLLTLLLAAFCYYAVTRGKQLGRVSGVIFLSIYCGWFTVMLVNA
jgi:cation:H+ antiporter